MNIQSNFIAMVGISVVKETADQCLGRTQSLAVSRKQKKRDDKIRRGVKGEREVWGNRDEREEKR